MTTPTPRTHAIREALASTTAADAYRRLRRAYAEHRTPRPVVRVDPVPEKRPFPQVTYAFAMGGIPPAFAGRTASVLAKTKTFSDQEGAECLLLTMNFSWRFNEVVRDLRARGLVGEHVRILNMFDVFSGVDTDSGDAYPDPGRITRYPVEVDGLSAVRDTKATVPVYRYYDAQGVYRFYRKYDDGTWFLLDKPDERLLFQDYFDEDRHRTRRNDFDRYGRLRRETYFDPEFNKPQREVFHRVDGSVFMERRSTWDPDTETSKITGAVLFDEQGKVTHKLGSHLELIHHYFDRVLAGRRVILSVESRKSDRETLSYDRDNVKQIYVLHNPHIRAPFARLDSLSYPYQGLFERRDDVGAIVFLTNAQRADAEAAFGSHDNFVVIPHHMTPVEQNPAIERDPHLVVMLARLDQQKQIDHAIRAFARVVAFVPDARLEIFGNGPDEKSMADLIVKLGVADNVRLMGYTTDPSAVYQRATASMLTSRYEGFGRVILESLANGCPVVSYDIKYGPGDMIHDGENGFLIPAGDIEAMASRITTLLTDAELAEQLRRQTRSTLADFSPEAASARWADLFCRLDKDWPADTH